MTSPWGVLAPLKPLPDGNLLVSLRHPFVCLPKNVQVQGVGGSGRLFIVLG
jgi:hypothetical protein